MANLVLTLLGAPRVERDGILLDITIRKAVALLAYLAVTGVPHTRDSLATLFWPEADQEKARGALRYTLAQLRSAIGDEWLHTTREQIALAQHPNIHIDVAQVDLLYTQVQRHGHPTGQPCGDCVEKLQAILVLKQGALLNGFNLPDSPDFDDWLFFESERLQQLQTDALITLISFHQAVGDASAAVPYAQRLVSLDPLREKVNELLIQLYVESEQHAAAIRHFELFTKLLLEEFDAEPEPELVELIEGLNPHKRATAKSNPTAPSNLRQEQVLPVPSSPLLGRGHELAAINNFLDDPTCRLLTLLGPGGSGKTRLALAIAHARQPLYPHSVYFVPLASLTAPDAFLTTLASAVGLPQRGDALRERLLDYLRERQLLLILDNLEHLLEFVTEEGDTESSVVLDLIDAILSTAPRIQFLVTSRVRLRLEQEQLYPVQGLDYPEWDTSLQPESYGAVQLFVQRARRVQPKFELTTENISGVLRILRILAGQPLAIELAAVWVASLTIDEIVSELSGGIDLLVSDARNVPTRHRSMRNVIQYSWQLASQEDQAALRRLSVFTGPFDRTAAQRVAGVSLNRLMTLLDTSLLQSTGRGRFRWHPMVRQYVLEVLADHEGEEVELRQRHLNYYFDLLTAWSGDMLQGRQKECLLAFDSEVENLLPLLRSLQWRQKFANSAMAFYTLFQFGRIRGRLEEFIQASDVALNRLDRKRATEIPIAYWHLLAYQACALVNVSRYGLAAAHFNHLMDKLTTSRSDFVIGFCYYFSGIIGVHGGDFANALSLFENALDVFERLDDKQMQAEVLNSLGVANNDLGNYADAIRHLERSILLFREVGYSAGQVYSYSNRAASAYNMGHYEEARGYLEEGLVIARDLQFIPGVMLILVGLADVANSLHDYQVALLYGHEALVLAKATHDARQAVWIQSALGIAELGLDSPDLAHEHFCRGIAAGIALKVTPRTLEAMVGLAHWQVYVKQYESAIRLLDFCLRHPSTQRKVCDRANRLLDVIRQKFDMNGKSAFHDVEQEQSLEHIAEALLALYNSIHKPPIVVDTSMAWE